MADTKQNKLHALDQDLERLRENHPGWRIWYVPRLNAPMMWCAQPLPLINSHSPEELEEEIATAEAAVPFGHPAGDAIG